MVGISESAGPVFEIEQLKACKAMYRIARKVFCKLADLLAAL